MSSEKIPKRLKKNPKKKSKKDHEKTKKKKNNSILLLLLHTLNQRKTNLHIRKVHSKKIQGVNILLKIENYSEIRNYSENFHSSTRRFLLKFMN